MRIKPKLENWFTKLIPHDELFFFVSAVACVLLKIVCEIIIEARGGG